MGHLLLGLFPAVNLAHDEQQSPSATPRCCSTNSRWSRRRAAQVHPARHLIEASYPLAGAAIGPCLPKCSSPVRGRRSGTSRGAATRASRAANSCCDDAPRGLLRHLSVPEQRRRLPSPQRGGQTIGSPQQDGCFDIRAVPLPDRLLQSINGDTRARRLRGRSAGSSSARRRRTDRRASTLAHAGNRLQPRRRPRRPIPLHHDAFARHFCHVQLLESEGHRPSLDGDRGIPGPPRAGTASTTHALHRMARRRARSERDVEQPAIFCILVRLRERQRHL